jgi:uncharacterized protein (TIGR03067 family)
MFIVGLFCAGALISELGAESTDIGCQSLLGPWILESIEHGGKRSNLEKGTQAVKITFTKSEVSVTIWSWKQALIYKCDSKTYPPSLSVINNLNEPVKVIFRIEHDHLTIGYNETPGGKPPASFGAKMGKGYVFLIFKRIK